METVVTPETYPFTQTKFGAQPTGDTELAGLSLPPHGRVALLVTYGSDALIAQTARTSYGTGTRPTRSDTHLLRYLVRHRHTSPLEHAEVVFFLRIPIFVARQLMRHRTANINEYSARYSEVDPAYYVPAPEQLAQQSQTNRQGRSGAYPVETAEDICAAIARTQADAFDTYTHLRTTHDVSRELARVVTPVGTYTELYWKCDLHNFFHFLQLRMSPHAQAEIRDVATAMYACVEPFFPDACTAWRDYIHESRTFSALELRALAQILSRHLTVDDIETLPVDPKMTAREREEFASAMRTLIAST